MKSKTSLALILSALFVAAATCQFGSTAAQPTALPSALPVTVVFSPTTSAASATPLPSATCCLPSPQPQTTATPDPNLGVGEVVYQDNFDGQSGWNWSPPPDGVVVWNIAGSQLNVVMQQANIGARWTTRPDISVGDQQVRVTANANLCYQRDEYGLLFRGNAEASNAYIFKLNCGGQARVEWLHDSQSSPLIDWTTSSAIVPGAPAENTLIVWMAKDQFHFYVNDTYLFSMKDSNYAAGVYGFYIRDRTNGGESISFSHLEAKKVTLP